MGREQVVSGFSTKEGITYLDVDLTAGALVCSWAACCEAFSNRALNA